MFHLYFSALFVTCIFTSATAQELNYTNYGVDEGLPSSQVHDIIQDRYGYLWFSTDRGLARYNGDGFENYSTAEGLTDNIVFKFHPQDDGSIWCTTNNKSIFLIKGLHPEFIAFPYNKLLQALNDAYTPQQLYIAEDGRIFLCYVNGIGFVTIGRDGKMENHLLDQVPHALYSIALHYDRAGRYFFHLANRGTATESSNNWAGRQLSPAVNHGDDFVRATYFPKSGQAVFTKPWQVSICDRSGNITTVTTDHEAISLGRLNDSLFWVGFRYGGLAIYNLEGKMRKQLLPGRSVTCLLTDHEGGYWFSTLNDGVFHASNAQMYNTSIAGSESHWVHRLSETGDGRIIACYYNGDVGLMGKGENRIISRAKIKKPAINVNTPVKNGFYYYTGSSIYDLTGKQTMVLKHDPLCLYYSSPDSLWIGSYGGMWLITGSDRHILSTGFRINTICRYAGRYYLGGNRGVHSFSSFGEPVFEKVSQMPEVPVSEIKIFGRLLAIATKGKGLLLYDGKKIQQPVTTEIPLATMVNTLFAENDSVLWTGSNTGLYRLALRKGQVVPTNHITRKDGLISNEINGIVVRNDSAWVGTRQGISFFRVSSLLHSTAFTDYFLRILHFRSNDQEADSGKVELPYDGNRVEIEYGAISFSTDKITYRFKLSGVQENWQYTRSTKALYPSLPPGQYSFVVQTKGENKSWEEQEARFDFIIRPPFWKTGWFYTACILLTLFLIYLFFRYRILSYNRDITRELLRQILKRFAGKNHYVVFREQGKDIRIPSGTICYVQADGNYIEIHTDNNKYVIRYKIGDFHSLVPDPLEYVRISRSCIIRLDKVQAKSKKDVTVKGVKLTVGETYTEQLKNILF